MKIWPRRFVEQAHLREGLKKVGILSERRLDVAVQSIEVRIGDPRVISQHAQLGLHSGT